MDKAAITKQHARERWKRYGAAGRIGSTRGACVDAAKLEGLSAETVYLLLEADKAFWKASHALREDISRINKLEQEIRDGLL